MNGDRQAFGDVYDDLVWNVYGFFAYRVNSRADAEDLTQMTFERALRAWSRYDAERGTVGTWLLAIARNLLIDHYRRDRSGRQEPIEGGGPRPRRPSSRSRRTSRSRSNASAGASGS